MIPNFINSSAAPSPFPADHDPHDHQFFFPNYQAPAASSSSSHVSYAVYFSSPQQDHHHHHQQQQPEYTTPFEMHQDQQPQHLQESQDVNHAPCTGSHDLGEKKKSNKSLKILWKNDEVSDHHGDGDPENHVKWMSSKMRMMQKMKKSVEDHQQKQQPTSNSSLENDHFSSNSNSSTNNSNSTTTTPFRVCADCNTTKTPLWRSGPKGPKSLCNACGIRQRKARRAMAAAAAAAAAANGTTTTATATAPQIETKTSLKIKVQTKEKVKSNNGLSATTPFKKRSKMLTAAASHHQPPQKNNVFEDFLLNLSKNLTFHRVFPQDEKEAAILLMALSCGLVHG